MLNIILFILLILVAVLIIISISFNNVNTIKYSGGGESDDDNDDVLLPYKYYFDEMGISTDIKQLDIDYFFSRFEDLLYKYFEVDNSNFLILLELLLLLFENAIFIKKLLLGAPYNIIIIGLFILNCIKIYKDMAYSIEEKNKILKIFNLICQHFNNSQILNILDIINNNCGDTIYTQNCLNALKLKFIEKNIYLYNKNKSTFNIYDAIEINFHDMYELGKEKRQYNKHKLYDLQFDKKEKIYANIMKYVDKLIEKDRENDINYQKLIFGNERNRDNNRDKLLNNLGLLIIGITETDYICILLYPILFRAFKKFQEKKEIISFGNQSGNFNLYSDINPATRIPFRAKLFEGGGYGSCKIKNCICTGFMPKDSANEHICSHCNHLFTDHWIISNSKSNSLLKKLKNANRDYQMQSSFNANQFGTELVEIFKDNFKMGDSIIDIPFFNIPIDYGFAQRWRPMLIKNLNDGFFDQIYDTAKRFIIHPHGSGAPPYELKTIDLYDNEIVIMSCAPNELINYSFIKDLIAIFYSADNHKTMLQYLLGYNGTIPLHRHESLFNGEYYRNNFCIYTKRCPNLSLQFFNNDSSDNKFKKSLPSATFEYPTKFVSNTIGDLLHKFPSMPQDLTDNDIRDFTLYDNFDITSLDDNDIILPNIISYLDNTVHKYIYDSSDYYDNYSNYKSLSDIQLEYDIDAQSHITRLNALIQNLDNDLTKEVSEREISTYYNHINPQQKDRNTLSNEIDTLRIYYHSLPDSAWADNPEQIVVYFVTSCRHLN